MNIAMYLFGLMISFAFLCISCKCARRLHELFCRQQQQVFNLLTEQNIHSFDCRGHNQSGNVHLQSDLLHIAGEDICYNIEISWQEISLCPGLFCIQIIYFPIISDAIFLPVVVFLCPIISVMLFVHRVITELFNLFTSFLEM